MEQAPFPQSHEMHCTIRSANNALRNTIRPLKLINQISNIEIHFIPFLLELATQI